MSVIFKIMYVILMVFHKWVIHAVFFTSFNDVCAAVPSSVTCVRLFVTPWTAAHQAPQFMGFSGQEYCSGEPSPFPGDLSTQGSNPHLLCLLRRQADSLLPRHLGIMLGRNQILLVKRTEISLKNNASLLSSN